MGQGTSRGLQPRSFAAECTVIEFATPKPPVQNMAELLSITQTIAAGRLHLSDGDQNRRAGLERVLQLMAADYTAWSDGPKADSATQTFLISCRHHLGRLDALQREHRYVHLTFGSIDTDATLPVGIQGRDLVSDITRAKKRVGEWLIQAVWQTDFEPSRRLHRAD